MPRFAKLLANFVIAGNLGPAWAGSLEADFQTFLANHSTEQQRADIFRRLGELPEDQLDQFLFKAIPYQNLIRPESVAQYVQFLSGLNAFGNENFIGYIFHILTQMKAGSHTLKPLIIYSLMKGGKSQVPRIENFLNDYRKSQSDADTLHAIEVMLEYLPAMKAQIATPVQVDINQRVSELNASLQTVWFRCPAKIWTPVPSTKPQAVFKDSGSGRSWLVNEHGLRELRQLPPYLNFDFKFDFSAFGSRPAIAIDLQKTFYKDSIYKGTYGLYLAVHEGFHHMFQRGEWKRDENGQRGDFFPGEAKARYYRTLVYQNLKHSLLASGGDQALGKAAFWYQKWKKEFPIEGPLGVDRLEGSAMYFDVMAVALSYLGCQSSKQDFLGFLKENSDFFFEPPDSLDNEGYQIGSLASIILYMKGSLDWQTRVVHGESPVDILLLTTKPIVDAGDNATFRTLSKKIADNNKETSGRLHGDLENFRSADFTRVLIPNDFDNKRRPVMDMIVSRAMPQARVWVVADGYLSEGDDGQYVKAIGPLPIFSGVQSPCKKPGQFVVVQKVQISEQGRDFIATTQFVDFRVQGKRRSAQGLDWLCTGE